MFDKILFFEKKLSEFTGAPYVITTDCCTHALELCFLIDRPKKLSFSAYTYLSVIQLMHKIKIPYELVDEKWIGEYKFHNSRVWDSARLLSPNMYKSGQIQCLSFGFDKPLYIGRGGAILTDDRLFYDEVSKMRYDGRIDLTKPWHEQKVFSIGYHYKLNPEECETGISQLEKYAIENSFEPTYKEYPDCREIKILEQRYNRYE